jgi:hypothetical protein
MHRWLILLAVAGGVMAQNCQNIGDQRVEYDPSCANGGLGCNAGGQGELCRFCGFSYFPACGSNPPPNNPTQAPLQNGHKMVIKNNCPYTVWPGALGNSGQQTPNNGGWQLNPGASTTFYLPAQWGGRFWGRTGCDGSGHCQTGDCGNKISCSGAGGIPPVTLAEFTFSGYGNLDYYDLSLVDGYNLPMQISPIADTYSKTSSNPFDCGTPSCTADLNLSCPKELQQIINGKTVACKSACEAFNEDEYCCRGAFGTAATCNPSNWATNYASIFKQACPGAYSYAYDDPTSTFTCRGKTNQITGYNIVFCP